MHIYARVTELEYVRDSKSRFCGFDPHLGHQLYAQIAQLAEHPLHTRTVSGSNPLLGTIYFGGLAQMERAPALQAGGHRFDPDILHHNK